MANGLTANKRLIQENEATIQEINDREAIDGKLDEEDRKVRDAAKAKIAEWKKANETLETCLLQFKGVIIQSKRTLVKNATQEAVTLQSCINDLLREAQGSFQKDLARLVRTRLQRKE